MKTETHAPFDHDDPTDIASEMFRKQVLQMLLDADKVTVFRELDPLQKLDCFIAGVLTGLVGASFAYIKPEGYDVMMEHLAKCLPVARKISEDGFVSVELLNIERAVSDDLREQNAALRAAQEPIEPAKLTDDDFDAQKGK